MESGVCDNGAGEGAAILPGPPGLAGTCRFCGTRGNSGLLAIGNVCADQQCQVNVRVYVRVPVHLYALSTKRLYKKVLIV